MTMSSIGVASAVLRMTMLLEVAMLLPEERLFKRRKIIVPVTGTK